MTSPQDEPLDWTTRSTPLGPPAAPVPDTASPAAPTAQPRKRRTGLIVGLVVVALLATGGTAAYFVVKAMDPKAQAIEACEKAVRAGLKAPTTAQFSSAETYPYGDGYRVTGDVDAQNGFGALIRGKFSCLMFKAPDGWHAGAVELP